GTRAVERAREGWGARKMATTRVGPWLMLVVTVALLGGWGPVDSPAQTGPLVIRNEGRILPYQVTHYPAGPTHAAAAVNVGNILNAHYYPGVKYYLSGNYAYAKNEMDYVLARPQYIENHPRRQEYLSNAYYIRGMIYFHHASGAGKYVLARSDFDEAIKLNAANHPAQLELARMMARAGQRDEAVAKLNRLLDEGPAAKGAGGAEKGLDQVTAGKGGGCASRVDMGVR